MKLVMNPKKMILTTVMTCALGVIACYSIPIFAKKSSPINKSDYPFPTWSQFYESSRFNLLLKGLGITSMIDLPAKDLPALGGQGLEVPRYVGAVATMEEAQGLQALYGSYQRSFARLEIAKDPLPKVDLILCWDLLSMLPKERVRAALLQFKKSGAHYVMLFHYPQVKTNEAQPGQEYVPINWQLPPFCFPEPIIQMADLKHPEKRVLALWSLSSL